VARDFLVLETVVDMVGFGRPAAAFYPGRELNGDPTNWWGPNEAAVHGMLRSVGFTRVETVTTTRSAAYRAARSHRQREHLPASLAPFSRDSAAACNV